MAGYKLAVRQSVAKDLRHIPKDDLAGILPRMKTLADDPRPSGSEKLSGRERYRVRRGDWRILYEIDDAEIVVTVVKV